ncbi:hypothetical protein [Bradyrhizobium elkanii]|uniref:hypothetical protein n=1 Tax=Bradyrhizobium elkanii TaxID=29448 RepID=UPI00155B3CBB|nr:hypothetical protein [Bradyrhizobium elkanii]
MRRAIGKIILFLAALSTLSFRASRSDEPGISCRNLGIPGSMLRIALRCAIAHLGMTVTAAADLGIPGSMLRIAPE